MSRRLAENRCVMDGTIKRRQPETASKQSLFGRNKKWYAARRLEVWRDTPMLQNRIAVANVCFKMMAHPSIHLPRSDTNKLLNKVICRALRVRNSA